MHDLEWFVGLPTVRAGVPQVLAGRSKMGTEVRWLHLGEHFNVGFYLRGGEVLLTYGLGLGDTPAERRRYIEHLIESGAAALVLELGPIYAEVPTDLVDACESLELPLITLERPVAYVEISREVHTALVNGDVDDLIAVNAANEAYLDALLSEDPVEAVLDVLTARTGQPAALIDSTTMILVAATLGHTESDLLLFIQSARNDPARQIETVPLQVSGGGPMRPTHVVLVGLNGTLTTGERAETTRAARALSVALTRDLRSARTLSGSTAALINSLIDEAGSADRVALSAAAIGFDPHYLLPFALVVDPRSGRESPVDWPRLARRVARSMVESDLSVLLAARRPGVAVGVMGLDEPSAGEQAADIAASSLARHLADTSSCVVLGSTTTTWRGLAVEFSRLNGPIDFVRSRHIWGIYRTDSPDLDRLLWTIRDNPDLQAFADRRLQPVLSYDEVHGTALFRTLTAYLHNGGHKAESARSLHIERPTLYDRLARIERLLGISWSNADDLLGVHLAARILRDRGHNSPSDVL